MGGGGTFLVCGLVEVGWFGFFFLASMQVAQERHLLESI